MKNYNGITLIALIITIIVLLILAGVSISAIVGDNGIVSQALKSKEKTEIAAIQEDVEILKSGEWIVNISEDDTKLTRQELLNKINIEYEGSYYVGNKIITADKQYQILIRNDENLTVIVSKYDGGSLEPGKLSMDLVENIDMGYIEIYVSMGGIKSYKEFYEEKMKDKTEEDKIQVLLDYTGCETQTELLEMMGVSTMEELYNIYGVDDIDDLLMTYSIVEGYDSDENTVIVNVSGGSGISETINLAYSSFVYDVVAENGTYKYTATSETDSIEKEITISWIDESVDDENIFTYDTTTGYITGVKEEYISKVPIQTYARSEPKWLLKGAPILNIPSEIDGTVIKGIDSSAFYEVLNISKVILPDTMEVIGYDAFFFCRNLRFVEFPSSITTLKDGAFWQTGIQNVYIPSTITTIEGNMFFSWEDYTNGQKIVIDCEVASKPSTWSSYWINNSYPDRYTINWGVTK